MAADGRSAALGRRGTGPFSLLGVTWTDPSVRVAGPIEVRTRNAADGAWSGWLRLDGDGGRDDGGAVRGGTEPAWVGPSDGVEVRVTGKETARLPRGLRLDMINPVGAIDPELDPGTYERTETPARLVPGPTPRPAPDRASVQGSGAGSAPGRASVRDLGVGSAWQRASVRGLGADSVQRLGLERSLADDRGSTRGLRLTSGVDSARGSGADLVQDLDLDGSLVEDRGPTRGLRLTSDADAGSVQGLASAPGSGADSVQGLGLERSLVEGAGSARGLRLAPGADSAQGPAPDGPLAKDQGPTWDRRPARDPDSDRVSDSDPDSNAAQVPASDRDLVEDRGPTGGLRLTPDPDSGRGPDSEAAQGPDPRRSLAKEPGPNRDLSRDPNQDPGPNSTVEFVPASPPPPMSTETAAAPRPPITSRAGWGADEGISPEGPIYLPGGKVKAVVVHHTAESNDYTCAQAPAVIRAIYAYHVQQLGWRDIGYNFLVDKCGTVYEGRKGGVDRPVMGAHTYGFNAETTGISVLGTFTSGAPSKEAMTSVARLAAWKLGLYGVDPAGTATLVAGADGTNYFGRSWRKGAALSFPAILGHRDGYNTQCPGDAFYAQFPTIRTWAAGPVTGLTLKAPGGVSQSGTEYYTKAAVTMNWAATTPSSLISRYEILVDGTPAVTAVGSAVSAQANLAPGTHQVAVRAVHQSGKTSTTPALTVIADTTAPTFPTKPNLALRTGTVDTAAVPLTLKWKAEDNVLLKEVKLTAPVTAAYGPAVTSAGHTAKSGAAATWSLTAHDQAGNTGAASVAGTPVILQETSATRTGTWAVKSSANYLGGQSLTSSTKNASLTWTFTGRSAAWVVSRATGSGQADIYVDGVKATTVDLKSAATVYRDAIWTRTWSTSGTHTVKIVVVGTSGRPTLTTDGLVHLK